MKSNKKKNLKNKNNEKVVKESFLNVGDNEEKSLSKDYFVKLTEEEKMELRNFLPDKKSREFDISKNKMIFSSENILEKNKEDENYFDQESKKNVKNIKKRNKDIIKNYEPDFSSEEKKDEKNENMKEITKKNKNFLNKVDDFLHLS